MANNPGGKSMDELEKAALQLRLLLAEVNNKETQLNSLREQFSN